MQFKTKAYKVVAKTERLLHFSISFRDEAKKYPYCSSTVYKSSMILFYDIGKITQGHKGTVGPLCCTRLVDAIGNMIASDTILECLVDGVIPISYLIHYGQPWQFCWGTRAQAIRKVKQFQSMCAPRGTIACWRVMPIRVVSPEEFCSIAD